jgi:hypothetical protein
MATALLVRHPPAPEQMEAVNLLHSLNTHSFAPRNCRSALFCSALLHFQCLLLLLTHRNKNTAPYSSGEGNLKKKGVKHARIACLTRAHESFRNTTTNIGLLTLTAS